MIRSMTGYGRRETRWDGGSLAVELRSVNHRHCEIVTRLARPVSALEPDLKHVIQQRCARGRIELAVTLNGGREGSQSPSLDRTLAKQYLRLLQQLQRDLRLTGSIDVSLLAGFRDIITVSSQPRENPRLHHEVRRLLSAALRDLDVMRRREGQALERDVKRHLATIRRALTAVSSRAPVVVREHFERMKTRVEKLVKPEVADRARLTQELAVFADRSDISEEIARLDSHLAQFRRALKARASVGRTLDFLLQEMGRETNTIGSKANDAEITEHVVCIKGELEKIREQVQNIE